MIVAAARLWLGTPFHWGASVRGVGCDCKGLIAGVARDLGRAEAASVEALACDYGTGRFTPERLRAGLARLFDPADEPEPGDVLLLKVAGKAQHLAIYAGNGRMIHTYSKGPGCVIEVPMGATWRRALDSIWRWRDGD